MDWLKTLLFNPDSIAHIILLYAIVIAAGVSLGKHKIAGISLGVACILFVGIVAGHFGFTANPRIIGFVQDFGLVLFVYSIGLQVGPSFFTSFKKGGMQMNLLAVGMVILNILVALGCYYLFFDRSDSSSYPMLIGVLSGAVTNTPGLGAADEALQSLNYNGPDIATGYACAYPFAVLGVILIPLLVKWICKIKPEQEEQALDAKEKEEENQRRPVCQVLEMQNKGLDGKTILELRSILKREFICSRLLHDGNLVIPHKDTIIRYGDQLRIVSEESDVEALKTILGKEVQVEWDDYTVASEPLISRRIIITKSKLNGKTLGELHLGSIYNVTVTRVVRSGTELFASSGLVLQVGDRLSVVGSESSIKSVANRIGNEMKRLDTPNITTMFVGILLGIIVGSIPLNVPGMPTPLKLGIAGGPLIVAILIGRFGYKMGLVTYTKASAIYMIRELGISLFLASVGIKSGANFVETVVSGGGVIYMLSGLLITIIPVFVIAMFARLKWKFNYYHILGIVAGSCTNPPALAFANEQTSYNAPAVSYSTVYPLTMFLRILTAQILILAGCSAF